VCIADAYITESTLSSINSKVKLHQ